MKSEKINNKSKQIPLTIAIPTYKRPKLLYLALYSAINQSNKDHYEIIVVDNCNEKNYVEKVDNLISKLSKIKNIRLIRNKKNIGMFGNWNRCIKEAKGTYVTILNDDDLLNYNFVENFIQDMNKEKMLIYDYSIINNNKSKKRLGDNFRTLTEKFYLKNKRNILLSNLIFRNPSNGSLGVIFKRKNAITIGCYDEKYYPSSDYYFNYKYIKNYGGIKINKKLCQYRISVNESLNKRCLKEFVKKDHELRKIIYLKFFQNKIFLIPILEYINFLQACSQSARYIFLRNINTIDFQDIYLGNLDKYKNKLISLLSRSKILCLTIEIIILLIWKILFLFFGILSKNSDN